MTKRNRTIGLTATGAALAALAFASTASANVAIECAPDPHAIRVTTTGHPAGQQIVTVVTQDGTPYDSRALVDDGFFDLPALDGFTYLATTTQYGYSFASVPFFKACLPPVVEQPKSEGGELGKEADKPREVGKRPAKKVKRPAKKRVITCRYLVTIGAGPREFTRRGWYVKCKAPVPKRVNPPVTG